MSDRVLLTGATGRIGRAVADVLAERRTPLILAARDPAELERLAAGLRTRHGADVAVRTFDASDFDGHRPFFADCVAAVPLAGIVLCHGEMPDAAALEGDPGITRRMIDVNYVSYVSLLLAAAEYFQKRRAGTIVVLSSVAGDRGRESNYVYGSTKAGLSVFLEGLRHRLHEAGVRVVTVKPGMADAAMWGRLKPGSRLVALPQRVAADVVKALDGRGPAVVYSPWFWRWIMLAIRAVPEAILRRLKL